MINDENSENLNEERLCSILTFRNIEKADKELEESKEEQSLLHLIIL